MTTRRLTWLIFAVALALTIVAFVLVDSRSHSGSDTLYGWVPIAAIICSAAAVLAILLSGTARGRR